ncbi:MAG: hypothetical protein H6Q52_3401 [Deltaproteobacteria bacterium]|nr:hypothetical protein [Deltaproteobacteria bacterium]
MVNIKICGMTSMEDCLAAARLGADFIGFVFYRKSPRYIAPGAVRTLIERLDGKVKTVGVFVEGPECDIETVMDFCGLDYAQVYNGRSGPRRIPVYAVDDHIPEVAGDGLILFDSYSPGFGGSGASFDTRLLAGHSALCRAFIAGGINEENVEEVLALNPFGVDFVSSVERYKGKKDLFKMERLVNKIRSCEI